MATDRKHFIITPTVEQILRAVNFYRYMTAVDITNLLFSKGSLTHVRSILRLLCGGADTQENQYLFRFFLPQITSGKTEKVFTLGSRGRNFLVRELGLSINWHSRPQDATHLSYGFISHNLTLTRFLVCAHLFAKKSAYSLDDVRISYDSAALFKTEEEKTEWLREKKKALEEIEGYLVAIWPSTSAKEKQMKSGQFFKRSALEAGQPLRNCNLKNYERATKRL